MGGGDKAGTAKGSKKDGKSEAELASDAEANAAKNEALERMLQEMKKKDELLKSELQKKDELMKEEMQKKDDRMMEELQRRDEVTKRQQEELDRLRRGGSRSRSRSKKSEVRRKSRSRSRSRTGSEKRGWKSEDRSVKIRSKEEMEVVKLEDLKMELLKMKRNMDERKLVFKKKGNKLSVEHNLQMKENVLDLKYLLERMYSGRLPENVKALVTAVTGFIDERNKLICIGDEYGWGVSEKYDKFVKLPLSSSDADEKILAKAKKAFEEDEVTKGKLEKKYEGRGGFGGGRRPYEYGGYGRNYGGEFGRAYGGGRWAGGGYDDARRSDGGYGDYGGYSSERRPDGGYRDGERFRRAGGATEGVKELRCFACDKVGHFARDCRAGGAAGRR